MDQQSMNGRYYRTSMSDIRSSQGWFGKICLLGLLQFVPVFGQMTLYGYAYEWAHKAAWGVQDPLPSKIYGRPGSKMLRWGWFALVIIFVFTVVPAIVVAIGSGMNTAGTSHTTMSAISHRSSNPGNAVLVGFGLLIMLIGYVAMIAASVFSWVGTIRMTMYDRLGSGLQFGKIWKMAKHDFTGLLRIFGMSLLWSFIISIIVSVVMTVLVTLVIGVAFLPLLSSGAAALNAVSIDSALAGSILGAVLAIFPIMLIIIYFACVAQSLVQLLVARAVGYWARQFDVANWGTQDAPLPFENAQAQASNYASPQQPFAQQSSAGQPYQQAPMQQDTYATPQTSQASPSAESAAAPQQSTMTPEPTSVPQAAPEPAAAQADVHPQAASGPDVPTEASQAASESNQ